LGYHCGTLSNFKLLINKKWDLRASFFSFF
jgi:hypothetical protein